jgi:hypothetical protein
MAGRTEETHEEIKTQSGQPFKISYKEASAHKIFLQL